MRLPVLVVVLVGATALAHAKTPPPPLPAGAVDLLAYDGATVAVSSTVANPKLLPAALVDGDLETAWNSRTNELAGAWIAIGLPSGAHVTALRLTAGFTHVEGKDDWFTMNPRISRIRISQGGRPVVERALAIDDRGMQTIPLTADAAGGALRLEIVATVAGSKATWREASISELQVVGTLVTGHARTTPLAVTVGNPPPPPPPPPPPDDPLLVVRALAPKLTAIAIRPWPGAAVAHGAAVAFADHVELQPIEEPATIAWGGRRVDLYNATGKVCSGTVGELAIAERAHRGQTRTLVAIVHTSAACGDALFARLAGATAPRYGKLEPTRLRTAIHAQYFDAKDDGYARLEESYQLNTLNGEYEDAQKNEEKLAPEDRLTEKNLDKTWTSGAACGLGAARDRCTAIAVGAYNGHEVAMGYAFDAGKITHATRIGGESIGAPVAAVDLDDDGAIDLIYETSLGLGAFGRNLRTTAEISE